MLLFYLGKQGTETMMDYSETTEHGGLLSYYYSGGEETDLVTEVDLVETTVETVVVLEHQTSTEN